MNDRDFWNASELLTTDQAGDYLTQIEFEQEQLRQDTEERAYHSESEVGDGLVETLEQIDIDCVEDIERKGFVIADSATVPLAGDFSETHHYKLLDFAFEQGFEEMSFLHHRDFKGRPTASGDSSQGRNRNQKFLLPSNYQSSRSTDPVSVYAIPPLDTAARQQLTLLSSKASKRCWKPPFHI